MMNVHPALIPSFCGKGFYGLHVHEAVLKSGVKVTGATVHFVNEVCDGGAIILQKAVDVKNGDTPESFSDTVREVIALGAENITVHTLAIKRGADLTDKAAAAAQRETVSQMLDGASHALQNAGYGPYYLYRQKFMAGGFENVGWCKPGTECFYNVSMMEELQTILSLGAGGVSKRVVRETGWIERANNPKYPLEYIQAADRLANGKKKLLFPKK